MGFFEFIFYTVFVGGGSFLLGFAFALHGERQGWGDK